MLHVLEFLYADAIDDWSLLPGKKIEKANDSCPDTRFLLSRYCH